MRHRATKRLAWTLCGVALVLVSATAVFGLVNYGFLDARTLPFFGFASAVVGGLVASRRPENAVGWLFLVAASGGGLQVLCAEYAIYGIRTDPGSLPGAYAAVWVSSVLQFVNPLSAFVLLPLLFPNGRLVSRRWRFAVLALALALPIAMLVSAFAPGEAVYATGIENPLASEALGPLVSVLRPVQYVLYFGLMFTAAASLVVRFYRAPRVERQQIKWLAFAVAALPVWFLVNAPVQSTFPGLFALLDALFIAGIPVAAGVAILRYRLYDIDLLINRALVYATLTASLLLLYAACVVSLQYASRVITSGDSQLAVVASTLAIAALFNPLRRRVQAAVDRRFYRRKYDAAKTLEAFGARLRDETDLEDLTRDVVGVARETMQPTHVSLWLISGRTDGRT